MRISLLHYRSRYRKFAHDYTDVSSSPAFGHDLLLSHRIDMELDDEIIGFINNGAAYDVVTPDEAFKELTSEAS